MKLALIALLLAGTALAGQPPLKVLKVSIDQYQIPYGGSNAVITVYKSTSLGTVATPFKPTAIFPATRTNTTITVIPGLYYFYATASVQPYGESPPSNTVTNRVNP
jgi:hypothetical protein